MGRGCSSSRLADRSESVEDTVTDEGQVAQNCVTLMFLHLGAGSRRWRQRPVAPEAGAGRLGDRRCISLGAGAVLGGVTVGALQHGRCRAGALEAHCPRNSERSLPPLRRRPRCIAQLRYRAPVCQPLHVLCSCGALWSPRQRRLRIILGAAQVPT